jgi:hypothetical protein
MIICKHCGTTLKRDAFGWTDFEGRDYCRHTDRLHIPQVPTEEPCDRFKAPPGGGYRCHHCGHQWIHHSPAAQAADDGDPIQDHAMAGYDETDDHR